MKVSLDCQTFGFYQKVSKSGWQQASNKQKVHSIGQNAWFSAHSIGQNCLIFMRSPVCIDCSLSVNFFCTRFKLLFVAAISTWFFRVMALVSSFWEKWNVTFLKNYADFIVEIWKKADTFEELCRLLGWNLLKNQHFCKIMPITWLKFEKNVSILRDSCRFHASNLFEISPFQK